MAIVFISPKQRQKMFFIGITVVFFLFIISVSLMVFLSKPKQVPQGLVFNKPKINVDLNTLDSDMVRNLEPWSEMKTQFDYRATKDGQIVEGKIEANSIEEARKILDDIGLSPSFLEESQIGRDNPFEPY
jgi:hypothetical protein